MSQRSKDVIVASLEHGGTLVVSPDREPWIYTESERAVSELERRGLDYYVTRQNSDTGDELELWIPRDDARWDLELD